MDLVRLQWSENNGCEQTSRIDWISTGTIRRYRANRQSEFTVFETPLTANVKLETQPQRTNED